MSEEIRGNVLLVDDNLDNQELLSRRVQREGHEVSCVGSGREALERMREGEFDAVLLDIMMPGMDGFEVLEAMRADHKLRELPVLVISALNQIENITKGITLGADDYLTKPFNPVVLRARLQACVEKKRLRDQERRHTAQMQQEKQRADHLLRVLLPECIASELQQTNQVRPRRHDDVCVLFADVADFSSYCNGRDPEEVLLHLQDFVQICEKSCAAHNLDKIKTNGDCFMATAGLNTRNGNACLDAVNAGIEILRKAKALSSGWQVRIGIHAGPVIAGVVGHERYLFDVWGDTVNIAARIQHEAQVDSVNVSEAVYDRIKDQRRAAEHFEIAMKGKGAFRVVRLAAAEE